MSHLLAGRSRIVPREDVLIEEGYVQGEMSIHPASQTAQRVLMPLCPMPLLLLLLLLSCNVDYTLTSLALMAINVTSRVLTLKLAGQPPSHGECLGAAAPTNTLKFFPSTVWCSDNITH